MTKLEKFDEMVYSLLSGIWKIIKKILHIAIYIAVFIGSFLGLNMLWPPHTFTRNNWDRVRASNIMASEEAIPQWLDNFASRISVQMLGYTLQGIDYLMLIFALLTVILCFCSFELPRRFNKKVINSCKYYSVKGGETIPWIVLFLEIICCVIVYHLFWDEPFSWFTIIELLVYSLFFVVFNLGIIIKVAPHDLSRMLLYNIILFICLGILLHYFLFRFIVVAGIIIVILIVSRLFAWWGGIEI